jgi:glycosyltransferase involved in cell wall biosynthesis
MHQKTKNRVSVILPVRERSAGLERCLGSIMGQDLKDFEVLVVDGSRDDETKGLIQRMDPSGKKLVHIQEDYYSIGALLNRGIMESTSEIVVLTDIDFDPPMDWISRITAPLNAGDGVVQGGLNYPGNGMWTKNIQKAHDQLFSSFSENDHIDLMDRRNLAARRTVLLEVGMFNRHVKALEGVEMNMRMRKFGHKVRYLKDLRIAHIDRIGLRDILKEGFEKGMWLYYIPRLQNGGVEMGNDELFGSLRRSRFIRLAAGLPMGFFREGILETLYMVAIGASTRIGVLWGKFQNGKFKRSLWARYD